VLESNDYQSYHFDQIHKKSSIKNPNMYS
jgi:hypothetical protein